DFAKLDSVNAHFMHTADDARLAALLFDYIAKQKDWDLSPETWARVEAALPVLKKRAKTIAELADQAFFLIAKRPLALDAKAQSLIKDDFKDRLRRLSDRLAAEPHWKHDALADALKTFATEEGVGLGQIGPGLRAALTGGAASPDLGQT